MTYDFDKFILEWLAKNRAEYPAMDATQARAILDGFDAAFPKVKLWREKLKAAREAAKNESYRFENQN